MNEELLPSLALIKALFATMLSISIETCVSCLSAGWVEGVRCAVWLLSDLQQL